MRQKIKEWSLTRRSKTSVDLSRHRERQFKGERQLRMERQLESDRSDALRMVG
jgi:hypothetical protein